MRERPGGGPRRGQARGWLPLARAARSYYAPTWRPAWGSRARLSSRHRTTTRVVVALVAQGRTSWYPPVACVPRLPRPGGDRRLGRMRRLRAPPGRLGGLGRVGGNAHPGGGGGLDLPERA